MTVSWVIGGGGLLGSVLLRALRGRALPVYVHDERFTWRDAPQLVKQLASAVSLFAEKARMAGTWRIYWMAGVGNMGSSEADMASETLAWQHLLSAVADCNALGTIPGQIAFASSAGAIYAGLQGDIIDEASIEAPTTPYADAKLEQERRLSDFCKMGLPVASLTARISTLYGPGQAHGKRQGLITHLARSIVRNRPVQIFVPFDTVRDYITAADAAVVILEALDSLSGQRRMMRIVASERPTSIAEIVATFHRVARRAPLIATSASRLSPLYLRRMQFRSALPLRRPLPHTGLPIGIAQVLAFERLSYASG